MTPEEQHAAWKAMADEHPGFAMLAYSLRFVGGPIPAKVWKARAKRGRKNLNRLLWSGIPVQRPMDRPGVPPKVPLSTRGERRRQLRAEQRAQ